MKLYAKQKVEQRLQDSLRLLREALENDNEALEALEVIEFKLSNSSGVEKESRRKKS